MTLECLRFDGVGYVDIYCIEPDQPGAEGKYGESDMLYWVPMRESSCVESVVHPGGCGFMVCGSISNRRREV